MRGQGLLIAAATLAALLVGCSATDQEGARSTAPSNSIPSTADGGGGASGGAAPGTDYSAYTESIVDCLNDRGWEATADADSVNAGAIPLGQEAVFDEDMEFCREQSRALLPEEVPLDAALYSLNYQRSQAARACLEAAGYDAPDAVSEQVWRDLAATPEGYPLYRLDTAIAEQFDAVLAQCPDPDRAFFSPEIEICADAVDYEAYWEASGQTRP